MAIKYISLKRKLHASDWCIMRLISIHTDGLARFLHLESKKQDTLLVSITLRNVNRFSKFFHSDLDSALSLLQNDHYNYDPTIPLRQW